MSKRKLIPFGMMPASWGLKGKSKARAQAEYELEGEELERVLAEIDAVTEMEKYLKWLELDLKYEHVTLGQYSRSYAELAYHPDSREYKEEILRLDLSEGHITQLEYERGSADIDPDKSSKEYKEEMLRIDHAENKISDNDYEKEIATLNNEPWVTMVSIKPDSDKPDHGEMELDWNDLFVEELKEAGYNAPMDDQIVDLWLADLCRNIALEQFSGVGDFDEKVGDGFISKTNKDDGKWAAK